MKTRYWVAVIVACGLSGLLVVWTGGKAADSGEPDDQNRSPGQARLNQDGPSGRTKPDPGPVAPLPSAKDLRKQSDREALLVSLKEVFNASPDQAQPVLTELLNDEAFVNSLLAKYSKMSPGGLPDFMKSQLFQKILHEIATEGGPSVAQNFVSLLGNLEADPRIDPYNMKLALVRSLGEMTGESVVQDALTDMAKSRTGFALYRGMALASVGRVGTEKTARAVEAIAYDTAHDEMHRYGSISALSWKATEPNLAALARMRKRSVGPDTDRRMVIALLRMAGLSSTISRGLKEPATGELRDKVAELLDDIAGTASEPQVRKDAAQAVQRMKNAK